MPEHERMCANIFKKCDAEGALIVQSKVDYALIRTLQGIALTDLQTVKKWSASADRTSGGGNAILKLGYDVLHALAESLCYFDNIKAERHECLFAYVCEKHTELEFDWGFLDRIRVMRNRSIYYGRAASYDDWKSIEFQLNLYIRTLKKEIEEKLKKTEPRT